MIGRAGIGVDNIDVPVATSRGIIVMNTPFGNSITTAEHTISMMMALARQISEADRSTQAGKWEKSRFMGVEVTSKTLGIIGCGNIGSIVADRAHGLKMKVIAYDPFLTDERAINLGVERVSLEELFRRADFITLHTPLTEKTKNIINAQSIATMKKGVRIINCARGGLVVEADLAEAIKLGHVAGAAIDVYEVEPAEGKCAVRPAECDLHAASWREHERSAGECSASSRRTDGGFSSHGRHLERRQLPVDHGGGSAEAAPLREACRATRLLRWPA